MAVLNQTGNQLATLTGNHLYNINTEEYGAPATIYNDDVLSSQPSGPDWDGWVY